VQMRSEVSTLLGSVTGDDIAFHARRVARGHFVHFRHDATFKALLSVPDDLRVRDTVVTAPLVDVLRAGPVWSRCFAALPCWVPR
jgi:hypothetical protein